MPSNVLLRKIGLIKPTLLNSGYAVLSTILYDGNGGFKLPQSSLPGIRYQRVGDKPWSYQFAGDGFLISHYDTLPKQLGWVMVLTLTHNADAAAQIIAAAGQVAANLPGGSILDAGAKLVKAIADMGAGARIVGTYIGSEVDHDDLVCDWEQYHEDYKACFTLAYDYVPEELP
jgi:hypothetical protein